MRSTADFSSETMKAKKDDAQIAERKDHQQKVPYPAKLSFKNEQKLRLSQVNKNRLI